MYVSSLNVNVDESLDCRGLAKSEDRKQILCIHLGVTHPHISNIDQYDLAPNNQLVFKQIYIYVMVALVTIIDCIVKS